MRAAPAREELTGIYRAALAAVDSEALVRAAVTRDGADLRVGGRAVPNGAGLVVLAVGKAAAAMAAAVEAIAGARIRNALAVTADGHGVPLAHTVLRETAHPVPDPRCEAAAREALSLVADAEPSDALLVLLSGGASSLLTCPAPGLDLRDLADTTAALLASGADIDETNAVRKHLSAVAGGRLGERAACVWSSVLAISDVPGDRLDVIGSGPMVPDPTTFADALAVVERRCPGDRLPPAVRDHLERGARGEIPETPKPGHVALARVETTLLATNRTATGAARAEAVRRGLRAIALDGALRGEARVVGARLAALARAARPPVPVCIVAGGETVVTVRGDGSGGRSQELALAAALGLSGHPGAALLAAGTDGADGPTDAAGAFADGDTVPRARQRGVDPRAALENNASHDFFERVDGLLRTGPTRTNVMDLALLRVAPAPGLASGEGDG